MLAFIRPDPHRVLTKQYVRDHNIQQIFKSEKN